MPSDVGRAAWFFLAPALLLIFVFFFLPVLASLVLSVTDFDIYAIANPPTTRFVGMANYTKLFHSPEFWQALKNTFYFAIVGGPLTIAVSIVWRYLYHTRYGVLNYALAHVGIAPIDWLGNPHWAMPAIILMSVWKNFGYNMLIFIAGLQAIPQDLYDAAEIDGAGPVRRFFAVTLPLLGPTLLFVSVITMIGYFQLFSEPYVMTNGGPLRSTTSVVLMMYEEGFRWWRMGYAASIAFVLFVVILIATLIQFRLQKDQT